MSSDQHMVDSSNPSEEPVVTTASTEINAEPEAEPSSSLDSTNSGKDEEPVQSSQVKELAQSSEDKGDTEHSGADEHIDSTEGKPDEALPATVQQNADETTSNVDSSSSIHTEHDQQAYANLEPILVAMELGQEILQGNAVEQSHTSDEDGKDAVDQMEVQQSDDVNSSQSDSTSETSSNVVAITQEQLASLFASSGGAAGGNVIVTSLPDGSAGQGGLSIATILQDVVSGIQQTGSSANGGATLLADSTAGAGSYYLVTQGGTIPIVMPSNLTGAGVTSMNLIQASSTDPSTFVTVNHDAVPEGVDVMATSVQAATDSEVAAAADGNSSVPAVQASNVESSGISEGEQVAEAVSSDHVLASAAAAVESDRTNLQEAVISPAVPVVSTTVKRRLSNGPRVCEQCNKAFKYPSDLKKHLQIHTDIKKFKCEECNRFFRRLHQLIVHQRIHSGEKPYVCKHCGTAFRHDSTLTMHVRTRHEHKRPFKCTFCDHTFGRLSHLRKHVKKVCGPNKQEKQSSTIFQCKFCEAVFPSKVELRKHTSTCEKKETKAKPNQVALHVCNICNKDFASPYNVRRHQLTHSDDRPFECEYCSKSFKEKSSLTKHVKRVHLEKNKDEPLEGNEASELVVGISSQDQQYEMVTMGNDENLLAVQSSTEEASGNVNPESTTTTVDSATLVQVAASVMVEELMHGDSEDQSQEDACTPVTASVTSAPAQQDVFIAVADKSDVTQEGSESYTLPENSGEITSSDGAVPALTDCVHEGAVVTSSPGQNQEGAVQVTSSQFDSHGEQVISQTEDGSVTPLGDSDVVGEGPGVEPGPSQVEAMECDYSAADEVITSTETTHEQVSA